MSQALKNKIFFYGTPDKDYRDSGLWTYLDYVRTFDEHEPDPTKVYKPLPRDKDGKIKAYVLFSFYCMLKYPELAIPKSRQIMMSWIAVIFATWVRRTGPNKAIYWQGMSEDEAAKMISVGRDDVLGARMTAIDVNLTVPSSGERADWLIDSAVLKSKGVSFKKVIGENSSRAIALAEGGDKIRGKVPTWYFSDECGFQDGFKEGYFNVQPCLAGGGHGVYFSSANNRSFFGELVGNGTYDVAGGDKWGENLSPVEGTKLYKNKESNLHVLWVHYTADEDKRPGDGGRGDEWFADAAARYAADGGVSGAKWRREMEIDFTAVAGNRVFGFANVDSPIFVPQIRPETALNEMKIIAGMDYGIRDPLAFVVWGIDKRGTPTQLWEYVTTDTPYKEVAAILKGTCPYFEKVNGNIVADGSMFKSVESSYGITSVADMYAQEGVHLVKADRRHTPSIDVLVADYFKKHYWADPDNPQAFIGSNCPKSAECVQNLKWDEHASQKTQSKEGLKEVIQHAGNDTWDATSYLFYRILPTFRRARPEPKKWTVKYIEGQLDKLNRHKRWRGGRVGA